MPPPPHGYPDRSGLAALALVPLIFIGAVSCSSAGRPHTSQDVSSGDVQAEADAIRATERQRLRALVAADVTTARRLHADDFQLINPLGLVLTKEAYIGGIASGFLDYLVWEPDSMVVRVEGSMAAIRYRSQLEIVVQGERSPRRPYWHTDTYEKRNGQWQVVWSQATEVK